jgi:hypothetical protein
MTFINGKEVCMKCKSKAKTRKKKKAEPGKISYEDTSDFIPHPTHDSTQHTKNSISHESEDSALVGEVNKPASPSAKKPEEIYYILGIPRKNADSQYFKGTYADYKKIRELHKDGFAIYEILEKNSIDPRVYIRLGCGNNQYFVLHRYFSSIHTIDSTDKSEHGCTRFFFKGIEEFKLPYMTVPCDKKDCPKAICVFRIHPDEIRKFHYLRKQCKKGMIHASSLDPDA